MRVLMAKVGLDGHDRGLRMIARELSARGAEVVLLGVGATPEVIASVAAQEDVDVVAVSILSGAHLTLLPRVVAQLQKAHNVVPLVCGGLIPESDAAALISAGAIAVAPIGMSVTRAADLILQSHKRVTS
jgi:methylmalonyl-CoA mutase C-terminal domain/subunit